MQSHLCIRCSGKPNREPARGAVPGRDASGIHEPGREIHPLAGQAKDGRCEIAPRIIDGFLPLLLLPCRPESPGWENKANASLGHSLVNVDCRNGLAIATEASAQRPLDADGIEGHQGGLGTPGPERASPLRRSSPGLDSGSLGWPLFHCRTAPGQHPLPIWRKLGTRKSRSETKTENEAFQPF